MSVSGRDLRESLNGGSKSESENLIVYGAIAGVVLLAAIIFVVVGLMSTHSEPKIAEIKPERLIETQLPTASYAEDLAQAADVKREYNQTLAKISMCGHGKDRKKFEEIRSAYEKRNAAAIASWEPRRSKVYDKMMSGNASDIDIMLHASTGGMQKDVMADLTQTMALLDVDYERMTPAQCMKFSGDVRMKKFDIEPRS